MYTYHKTPVVPDGTVSFFVAPNGNDAWSGRLPQPNAARSDGPFARIERARDAVRAMTGAAAAAGRPAAGAGTSATAGATAAGATAAGAIIVEIAAGTYQITEPIVFTAADSGTAALPVVYRAAAAADVRLMGGRIIEGFTPVTDAAVRERLDPAARDHVLRTNLRAQGIDDFGSITAPQWAAGQPGLELFFKGRRMTIARWPNDDFVKIADIDVPGNTPLVNRVTQSGKMRGSNEGRFHYEGERPQRWVGENDGWLHGYWFWDWADQRYKIDSIDPQARVISLQGPRHGFGFRAGQWYYALNLLCELDMPGEWYLDRESGELYFWPPEPLQPGDAAVSIAPVLIDCREASHLVFQGLTLENVRGTAVTMSGGSDNLVCSCAIRNASGYALRVDGGEAHGIVGCDLYELGEGGVRMEGGDRPTLTPGRHYAVNNHVHHCDCWNPLYHPGIAVFGVGNRVAHNLLENLPHVAIGFTGNDQLIEYNEIHSCVYMANDAGAIYTSPPTEELTMYGHVIRFNYVHHLYGFRNRGCNGAIYLDDFFPGTTIYGNVFFKVPRAAFVGGGRYCTIENNLFVDCDPALHIDARGLGWAAGGEQELIQLAKDYPYQGELWRSRYPSLFNVLEDEPMVPKGNVVARNVVWKGSWDEIEDSARPHVVLEGNIVGVDPLLIDADNPARGLRAQSPVYAAGFAALPFAAIGLVDDALRRSWPVVHFVRPGGHEEVEDKTW